MIEENNKQKKAVPVQEQPQPAAVPPVNTSAVQAPAAQPQPDAGADMAQPASGVAQPAQTGTKMSTLDRIIKPRLADNTAVKFEQPLARPAEIASKQEMDNARPYKTKDGFTYKANTGKLYDDQGRELSPFAYAVELADKNRMTPEEKAAEAKRERRTKIFSAIGDGISALANLYFTSKGAPDMYNPSTSMSAKTKAYWDKLNAERKANEDKYNDLLLGAYKADNADRDAKDKWQQQLEQWKIEMERKNEAETYKRGKDAADAKYRKEKDDADRTSREKIAASQIEAANRRAAADRSQRQTQFDIRYGGKGGGNKSKYTFSLGRGKGTVSVDSDAVNDANVRQIYDRLPEEVRRTAQERYKTAKIDNGYTVYAKDKNGKLIYGPDGKLVPEYQQLSKNEMLEVIGANLEDNPDLENDIRELAGQPGKKKPNPMGGGQAQNGSGKKPNPMN